jgi:hypothetical protein
VTETTDYDDEYPKCEKTFVTLRIFSEQLSPSKISELLGISLSHSYCKGDPIGLIWGKSQPMQLIRLQFV